MGGPRKEAKKEVLRALGAASVLVTEPQTTFSLSGWTGNFALPHRATQAKVNAGVLMLDCINAKVIKAEVNFVAVEASDGPLITPLLLVALYLNPGAGTAALNERTATGVGEVIDSWRRENPSGEVVAGGDFNDDHETIIGRHAGLAVLGSLRRSADKPTACMRRNQLVTRNLDRIYASGRFDNVPFSPALDGDEGEDGPKLSDHTPVLL